MSIVVMDIIYIAEIALAAPSPPGIANPLIRVLLATYRNRFQLIAGEGVHQIAVRRTEDSQAPNGINQPMNFVHCD